MKSLSIKILLGALCLAFCACDGGNENSDNSKSNDNNDAKKAMQTASPEIQKLLKVCDVEGSTELFLTCEEELDKAEFNVDKLKSLETICNGGHGTACFIAAMMYGQGNGVEQNEKKALEFAEKACNLGDIRGCIAAGYAYIEGTLVGRNWKKAAELLEKGCNKTSKEEVKEACKLFKMIAEALRE